MNSLVKLILVFGTLSTLAACTFGNGRICGPQTAMAECDKEAYEKLVHPKAYGEHWVKQEGTLQQRREDSWACGAARTVHGADHVVFTSEQEKAEKHSEDKDEFAARTRLSKAWVNCMKEKGYKYIP